MAPNRSVANVVCAVLVAGLSGCVVGGPQRSSGRLGPEPHQLESVQVEAGAGVVVAGNREAADAGAAILAAGGNAVDAAVAAGFVLSATSVDVAGLGGAAVVSAAVDRGLGLPAAVSAPRVLWGGPLDKRVDLEITTPKLEGWADVLESRGFTELYRQHFPARPFDLAAFGGTNALVADLDGAGWIGVADPRRGGAARAVEGVPRTHEHD